MNKAEIMVLTPVRSSIMPQLEERFDLLRADKAGETTAEKEAFVTRHGANCRALLCSGNAELTVAMLDAMPQLGHVSCLTAGYDGLPLRELAARGVTLSNTSPALRDDVADMAILLMLAGKRDFVTAETYVRSGDWATKGMFPLQRSVSGKRLGIVGLGSLGQAVATRAQAFNMQVSYWNRREKNAPLRFHPDLIQLASESDVLIVTVAGGPETENLISADVMQALGPDGLLVNISRGSVIDEPALIDALQSGKLGAAALDVFASEPDPDPRLTALRNVTLSPHHASGTEEARNAMAQLAVDNIFAFMDDKPLISPVSI
ncbi:2-hydroxyacid dehydrogenase [Paracoccus albus]|uniref:2-hydroxyacid dehydrogenase n=1 Tax=Paracoccus albus TaxID=3017784 RepID=UPI0022F0D4BB|nr:2-hydroxyacid dehydrogenase [Paracoccus albus]WBU59310.1 2-hydroxyacid dehydrogenase [Paracoccus albus]